MEQIDLPRTFPPISLFILEVLSFLHQESECDFLKLPFIKVLSYCIMSQFQTWLCKLLSVHQHLIIHFPRR